MIANKAVMAAAVLLFAAPVVPAVAHDDYGDHVEHLRLHRDVSEEGKLVDAFDAFGGGNCIRVEGGIGGVPILLSVEACT